MTASLDLCSIPGCDRPLKARGWCITHYIRWHNWGTPKAHEPIRERTPAEWVNPLVCECPDTDADPARNFGQCSTCKRKPLALMAVQS